MPSARKLPLLQLSMLDRHVHLPDFHLERLTLCAGQRMLCLAPHPDDEVLGGGGLLLLAQRQGLRVRSVIVTAGEQGLDEKGAAANPRLEESLAAADSLGLPAPECWRLPDRQLRHSAPLIERIAALLREDRPRWLLLPALTEPHPDHQVLALAGLSAAQALAQAGEGGDMGVLFYEVGSPTQVNTLVDITPVADAKWTALQAFGSQEERHGYLRHAQSMAALRAFGAGPQVRAAEAFWQVDAEALRQPGVMAALSSWPLQRNRIGLASEPAQQPLVSIIVRSMNRPSLPQAVASIAQQTYPNIEVVVVNASGAGHPAPPYPVDRLRLQVVGPEPAAALDRSAAANLGLQTAQGAFLLFLDDDDLLAPDHIERLADALVADSAAIAAYSGVRVEGPDGQWLRDYDMAWEPRRLRGINHLPIHSVLFRRDKAAAGGARFDESLPVLEDWDFWCQLAHVGHFVHVPGVSAVYRQGLGSSHLSDPEHANHWSRWHQLVLHRHAQRWGAAQQSDALAWHAIALDRAEQAVAAERLAAGQQAARHAEQQAEQARLAEQARQEAESALLRVRAQSEGELQRAHFEAAQQRQLAEARESQLQAELDLAKRSLEMLKQSRAVRFAGFLRRLAGGRDH